MPLETICYVCKRTIAVRKGRGFTHGCCDTCLAREKARLLKELEEEATDVQPTP